MTETPKKTKGKPRIIDASIAVVQPMNLDGEEEGREPLSKHNFATTDGEKVSLADFLNGMVSDVGYLHSVSLQSGLDADDALQLLYFLGSMQTVLNHVKTDALRVLGTLPKELLESQHGSIKRQGKIVDVVYNTAITEQLQSGEPDPELKRRYQVP